jgi:LmbE family N-acetylglucosaminyl deacetylase
MKTIIVAPHADDEVLGVGGTLLRRKFEGAKVAWLLVTSISVESGWDVKQVRRRAKEVTSISSLFGFDSVFKLEFPAAELDQIPVSNMVSAISKVFKEFEPEEVFLPHPSDIHTDHRVVFNAAASCVKWFRHPSIKRVLAYETLSETDFGLIQSNIFRPNVFIDIEQYLEAKLLAINAYESEFGEHPFPRSPDSIQALATLRGAASGFRAAEAFELLRERL